MCGRFEHIKRLNTSLILSNRLQNICGDDRVASSSAILLSPTMEKQCASVMALPRWCCKCCSLLICRYTTDPACLTTSETTSQHTCSQLEPPPHHYQPLPALRAMPPTRSTCEKCCKCESPKCEMGLQVPCHVCVRCTAAWFCAAEMIVVIRKACVCECTGCSAPFRRLIEKW